MAEPPAIRCLLPLLPSVRDPPVPQSYHGHPRRFPDRLTRIVLCRLTPFRHLSVRTRVRPAAYQMELWDSDAFDSRQRRGLQDLICTLGLEDEAAQPLNRWSTGTTPSR